MSTIGTARNGCAGPGAFLYQRHRPEKTLLYQLVSEHYPVRQWVLSFPFQLRFLFASRPLITGQVLGMVYRVISMHLVKKAGYSRKAARTGAVTLIQRFGGALNLNIHFHMLFLDAVCTTNQYNQSH